MSTHALRLAFATALLLLLAAVPLAAEGGACFTSAECAEGELCATLTGHCDGPGQCTLKPEGCFMVYDPVCGCDGQTYGNACLALQAGVNVAHLGECDTLACTRNSQCPHTFFCLKTDGDCDAVGYCAVMPEFCTMIYSPVCGCDGQTYGNACLAAMSGVSVDAFGVCPDDCSSTADCAEGFFCNFPGNSCNPPGSCEPLPEFCPRVLDPVCGCDGQIYTNSCYAYWAGVSVANPGDTCRPSVP